MSETAFRHFGEIFPVAAEVFYAACFFAFFKPLIPKGGRGGRKGFAVFAVYLVISLFCRAAALPQGTFGLLLMAAVAGLSGVLGLKRKMAVWFVLLCWNVRTCAGLMAESLFFLAERLQPSGDWTPEAVYSRAAGMVMFFLLSHGALFLLMLYLLKRQLGKQRIYFCLRELLCLSVIPAAGVLFGRVVSGLLFEFQDSELPELYERHPAFLAVIPVLALLFYVGTFLTVAARQEMARLREEEAVRFVERQQTEAIRARLRETERHYRQICGMKHEMRGHMANIGGLLRKGRYDELEQYIARMNEGMGELEAVFQTGNAVTDVIVNDRRRQCQEAGISFQADFHYPETGGYEAFDVGIILQNLLQNALEAAEKAAERERFVALTGRRRGKFFLIEVKNSFAGEVTFGPGGLPLTTKREEEWMHGIGLANVRRTAEKCMGELELRAEGQEFCATVLLQERSGYESFDASRLRHGAVRLSGESREGGDKTDTDGGGGKQFS